MIYRYENFSYIAEYLEDAEVAFMILFSDAHQLEIKSYSRVTQVTKGYAPVELIEGDENIDLQDDDGMGHAPIELCIALHEPGYFSVEISGDCNGWFTRFYPGSHENPPEGGEPMLDSITIEKMTFFKELYGKETKAEINSHFVKPQMGFTYANLYALAEECAAKRIEAEPSSSYKDNVNLIKEIPHTLQDKIERLFRDHHDEIMKRKAARKFNI